MTASLAALVIVTLSNEGHWLAGHEATIRVEWAAPAVAPKAVLRWGLGYAGVRLADGWMDMGRDGATLRIEAPSVRAPIEMRWAYHVVRRSDGRQMAVGDAALHIYPPDQLNGLADVMRGRTVVVWDPAGGFSAALHAAGIEHRSVRSSSELAMPAVDIILVGPETLTGGMFEAAPLLQQASRGAAVLIFRQTRMKELMGHQVTRRWMDSGLSWRVDHPLLRDLTAAPLDARVANAGSTVSSLRLRDDGSVVVVGQWPADDPPADSAPIHALVVVQRTGDGCVMLCQAPLDRIGDDVLSRLFLRNALNYLANWPRSGARRAAPATVAAISNEEMEP